MTGNGSQLKIGLLHYSCPPVVGGVEEVLRQQAHWLDRLGHEIHVLAGMGEKYTNDYEISFAPLFGSQDDRIRQANALSKDGNHQLTMKLTQEIYQYLQTWAKHLDIILAHNVLHMPFNLPLTLALHRVALLTDRPALVSWAHDSPYFSSSCPEHFASPPWDAMRRQQPGIHYVTISNSRHQFFQKHLGDFSWKVISNGVDPVDFFHLDARVVKLMKELNLESRDLVMVMPARVTPRKNVELAIHIVLAMKNENQNILFLLTGAHDPHEPGISSYYRRLKYWIGELGLEDNVAILAEHTFAGGSKLVPDLGLIRDLYLVADLLIMTSKNEGFCLPLLEAGLIKLPIACPDIPPFTEVGQDLCFFRLNDPPKVTAGRIMDYLANIGTHRMYRKVMRNYKWEMICKNEINPFLLQIAASHKEAGLRATTSIEHKML